MANYFPWEYSSDQMRGLSRDLLESLVASHNGTVLRAPAPVSTGGVTVFWADFAGRVPSGAEVLTRMYHFAWNDVEYYFACQEELGSRAGIIRGCDQIFSTRAWDRSLLRPVAASASRPSRPPPPRRSP